jgi:hypothetical protein
MWVPEGEGGRRGDHAAVTNNVFQFTIERYHTPASTYTRYIHRTYNESILEKYNMTPEALYVQEIQFSNSHATLTI